MFQSNGKTDRRLSSDPRQTNPRVSTNEFTDWLAEQARRYSEKQLANVTGLSLKAVQNLRLGRSGGTGTTIATWCRNDARFRAEYFFYCGGHLETDPEGVAALHMAINSYLQRGRT